MGTEPALLSLHQTPYQTSCAEAGPVYPKLYASLWLLLSCLFQVVSPQLSCNSRLVLGGDQCDFHALLCHLPSEPPTSKEYSDLVSALVHWGCYSKFL